MTSASIAGIHVRSNQYYVPSILSAFGYFPCPAASFRMKLFVSRFPLLQQANLVFSPGFIVLMGNASPRAAGHKLATTGRSMGMVSDRALFVPAPGSGIQAYTASELTYGICGEHEAGLAAR